MEWSNTLPNGDELTVTRASLPSISSPGWLTSALVKATLASANRDTDHFDDPHSFRLDRPEGFAYQNVYTDAESPLAIERGS